MNTEIKASFRQIQIKGDSATAQFTVMPGAKGFDDLTRMVGQNGLLAFSGDQQEIPVDEPPEGQTTINNYFVNAETGEVTEPQDDYLLPEGGE